MMIIGGISCITKIVEQEEEAIILALSDACILVYNAVYCFCLTIHAFSCFDMIAIGVKPTLFNRTVETFSRKHTC